MNDFRRMAMNKLHNIELRHQLAPETEYTKMLDRIDWADFLEFLQLAEQQEQKVEFTVDEASYKNVEKKLQDLCKSLDFGR